MQVRIHFTDNIQKGIKATDFLPPALGPWFAVTAQSETPDISTSLEINTIWPLQLA